MQNTNSQKLEGKLDLEKGLQDWLKRKDIMDYLRKDPQIEHKIEEGVVYHRIKKTENKENPKPL